MSIVELDYFDLIKPESNLHDLIQSAYGISGVGLLTVKNVPGFVEARKRLLPLSKKFSELPDDVKEKYVHKESLYSFGWSHGKENLQGKPDLSKGSYYANPQYDRPIDDESVIKQYSSFVHPNIWPSDDLPEFEVAFKELGQIIVATGTLVARHCDKYTHSRHSEYPENTLERIISTSKCCKARLLHYFPLFEEAQKTEKTEEKTENNNDKLYSSWCGWHNDHGSLTGLTSAMFLDKDGNEVANQDKEAGEFVFFV
jgi:isopenicillin N synthase-like dioxygenase